MTISIQTDNHIQGSDGLSGWIEEVLNHDLARFTGDITRIEVHLADENGPKGKGGGDDKRCTLDCKVDGFPNFAATALANDLHAAIKGASGKLKSSIGTALDKRRGH